MPPEHQTPDPLFLAFQGALAGRYSIDRELGRGGMGVVYLAREVHLDRLVAIKLLPPELASRPTLRQRFLREAQLAAKLSHPHIVPIHSVDEVDGFVYFAMAYVDGETLGARVAARGPLAARDGTRLLREVAWALGYAHAQGLVHRDIKPDNILIEAGTGRALVADFGIAGAAGTSADDTACGTPEFMSPEQGIGGDVDERSDLYSLGATAYYALSGYLPFTGDSATQVLARQVATRATPLATVAPSVPRRLAQLVDWCLAKSPDERPPSANALAEQLAQAAEARRDMPAALRAFVKRTGRLDGSGTILSLLGAATAGVAMTGTAGGTAGLATTAALLAAGLLAFGIGTARHLLTQGFTHADLAPAYRAEADRSREEHELPVSRLRRAVEWLMGGTARISATTTAVLLVPGLFTVESDRVAWLRPLIWTGALLATGSAMAWLAMLQQRREVDLAFWRRVWTGRIGQLAFAVAGRLRAAKPAAQPMTHRATELSLSLAAEGLFERLPRETQRSLHDLPPLLERLHGDAQRLRRRHDELQDALHHAGPDAADERYAPLREERDHVHERLRQAVAALETIRLGLLRLHAGSLSLEGLTTHVGQAIEVAAGVDRLLAAQGEVQALLASEGPASNMVLQ